MAARRFVVQRHRATRDHYDLRLEVGDTLASWAVPKGPTLNPAQRRTAFRVGDHPLEYFDFEGVIPKGGYGAGDVVVWDWGTYEPHVTDDPASAIARGELHVDVHGEKLRGRFVLVRRLRDGEDAWLLVHKRDEYAVEGWVAGDHPRSVKSGRTNDEVRADPERAWHCGAPAARASVPLRFDDPNAEELVALDGLATQGTWTVHGRDLTVTNLDKVLFPARPGGQPVTKRDLLRYAAQIGPTLVPYLRDRALNMHRYPDGAGARGSRTRSARPMRPGGSPAGRTRTPTPARPGPTSSWTSSTTPNCDRIGGRCARRSTGPGVAATSSGRCSAPSSRCRRSAERPAAGASGTRGTGCENGPHDNDVCPPTLR